MTERRKCDKCGAMSFETRILNTPNGKIALCWDCRREREKTYKATDLKVRNEANRLKQKLLKARGRYCQQCGRFMQRVVGHHLVALRLGGTNTSNNLLLLCEECHQLEHAVGTRY